MNVAAKLPHDSRAFRGFRSNFRLIHRRNFKLAETTQRHAGISHYVVHIAEKRIGLLLLVYLPA
jgi:hypothetical protein